MHFKLLGCAYFEFLSSEVAFYTCSYSCISFSFVSIGLYVCGGLYFSTSCHLMTLFQLLSLFSMVVEIKDV
jgi:hypothetical protein